MPKELIVSLNGREKKIAIVENGRTTEFYIERGESEQGIVGNIYKGRVMRVLPGMQSAFVDIGLERDAFLYVSDFFDEEEEFERIVVDKKKGEGADDETAARAAAERIERARVERERQIETAQERAEPGLDEGVSETDDDAEEEAAPPARVREEVARAGEREAEDSGRRGKRGGRGGGRERDGARARDDRGRHETAEPGAAVTRGGGRRDFPVEDISTPFVAGADSFERVVDEDAAAIEEGSMFKDARLQERLTDQIRGVEFDIEDTPAAEVGSLLSSAAARGDFSFQRVEDDSGEADAGRTTGRRAAPTAARVAHIAEEFDKFDSSKSALAGAQTFERVSDDDEKAVEAVVESPATTVADKKSRARKGAASSNRSAASKKSASKKSAAKQDAEEDEGETKKKSRSTVASKSSSKKSTDVKKSATKSGARGNKSAAAEGLLTKAETEAGEEAAAADGEAAYEDSDARIKGRASRGEFARRGGRRRRRPTDKAGEGTNGDQSNGHGEEAEPLVETDEPAVQVAAEPAPPTPAPARERQGEDRGRGGSRARAERGERSERGERGGRGERGERSARGGRDRERGNGREESGPAAAAGGRAEQARGGGREERARGGGRERRGQPTITDLLREGQEIIVQIAKEPIAQKGARITSHIALPGRFLVYMPTIEHVGVSRKIESDSERVRLRKLIQAIVKEEDVPSGGFIVRTAGVGMIEQDLRDDARYLVRTWLDIRRNAEKQKAPALAHRDLDLVQRILRDQLSDDFTAIRVDSEEEYLAVVEFVNRIQPRLVNRVKLYTREEPILEAYGVQAEIDKAIKPRVWLKSGGYLVINQTEALVAIDVNTGKFVGRGGSRLEDTITRTNLEAVDEIARQIRLRDLGGIIVLDLIDMEDRRNRNRVMGALQDALRYDKSPTKVLSINDFGLVIMTRKRVKQSLERTLCSPCPYCQGSSMVKSPQTVCYEILEEARSLARHQDGERIKQTTLRVNTEVSRALRSTERDVLGEIEVYLGPVDITSDESVHQEQFDFAFI